MIWLYNVITHIVSFVHWDRCAGHDNSGTGASIIITSSFVLHIKMIVNSRWQSVGDVGNSLDGHSLDGLGRVTYEQSGETFFLSFSFEDVETPDDTSGDLKVGDHVEFYICTDERCVGGECLEGGSREVEGGILRNEDICTWVTRDKTPESSPCVKELVCNKYTVTPCSSFLCLLTFRTNLVSLVSLFSTYIPRPHSIFILPCDVM